jgi:hypothetical protein
MMIMGRREEKHGQLIRGMVVKWLIHYERRERWR